MISNKVLCGAIVKSVNESYGHDLEDDDGTVGHLANCDHNLSPDNVVDPARDADLSLVARKISRFVLPLLDEGKLKIGLLALRAIAISDNIDADTSIGRMKFAALKNMTIFNPADFIGDLFIYTATVVDNKSGKDTIKQVTKDFVLSFGANVDTITIDNSVIVETEELSCTLDNSGFDAVFKEVEHPESLQLRNSSKLKLYYLDISDSSFDYAAIGEYLLDCASMYVYNRMQIKDFEDLHKIRTMGIKALRLMQANGHPDERGTGNELGEMLLFTFMEGALHAPKLLSKVEIVTAASQYNSKSDSVHLLKRKINGATSYQLVFGTSCINGDIKSGIDFAFSALTEIKTGKVSERNMVDNTLLNRTFDSETTAWLRQILIPSRDRTQAPDLAFGVFIGYSLGMKCDDNDAFREKAIQKMKADIKKVAPYIMKKIADTKLEMHSYYFYFLPLNNAEEDKRIIMANLLGGEQHE